MIIDYHNKFFVFDIQKDEPNDIFYEICWLNVYFIEYHNMTNDEASKWSNIYKNIKYYRCKYDNKIHNYIDKLLNKKEIHYNL